MVLVDKLEVKMPIRRPRHRWEGGIKTDLRQFGWGMERTNLTQERNRWWVAVSAVTRHGGIIDVKGEMVAIPFPSAAYTNKGGGRILLKIRYSFTGFYGVISHKTTLFMSHFCETNRLEVPWLRRLDSIRPITSNA